MKKSNLFTGIAASLTLSANIHAAEIPDAVMNTLNANHFTVMQGKGKDTKFASGYLNTGNILSTVNHVVEQKPENLAFIDGPTFKSDKKNAKGCFYSKNTKQIINDVKSDFSMVQFPINKCNPINIKGLDYKIDGAFPEILEKLYMECNGSNKAAEGLRDIVEMRFKGTAGIKSEKQGRELIAGMLHINTGVPNSGCSGAAIVKSDGTIIGNYVGDAPNNITGEYGNFFYTPAQGYDKPIEE